eukprot:TRINITY_DN64659_c0_g1_i1.p1 TRINITY_DN64659_c0_g1~~TRINITY_DN64659_c0_g1_i1.p1  ORF type:complete len:810 (+),score=161.31 TRINITY_DN64659_c0_g1_i1:75-2504(+)
MLLLQRALVISAAVVIQALGFSLDVRLGSWHVRANDTDLTLVSSTGVTWESKLLQLQAAQRYTQEHNGCWHRYSKPAKELAIGQLVSAQQGSSTLLTLEGNIVQLPSEGGVGNQSSARWYLTLRPHDHLPDVISFNVTFERIQSLWLGEMAAAALKDDVSTATTPVGGPPKYWYTSAEVSLLWSKTVDEKILGGGEQYSTVDLNGKKIELWSGEQGIGRGLEPVTTALDTVAYPCGGDTYTTYSHVPVLMSTAGYGVVIENSQLITADFTDKDVARVTVSFEAHEKQNYVMSGHILAGAGGVRSLIPKLSGITGRMSSPPSWVLDGLVIGDEGGATKVTAHIDELVASGVPVVGVWIQDWSGFLSTRNGRVVWWNWQLDEANYPKYWFHEMAARGIKVLTYVNPFLASSASEDGRPPQLFEEASKHGYLVQDVEGKPLVEQCAFADFKFGTIDLFNPEAYKWWTDILRCNVMMACDGGGEPLVHGWMNDYGEYFPMNAKVVMNTDLAASDVHNQFSRFSAAAAREASAAFPEVAFFSRSGDLHSPAEARLFWLGDQLSTFDACDGLQSAVIAAMSGGLSGWTLNHADVGAFTQIDRVKLPGIVFTRDTALMVRWLEVCVFLNVMYRSHEGLVPTQASQPWDGDVVPHTVLMSKLFAALKPYRQALIEEAVVSGLPPVRHGILVFPEDGSWFNATKPHSIQCRNGDEIGLSQFFFGDEILVAPALSAASSVNVYLPAGNWVHFWTQQVVTGPVLKEWDAPLGKPLFFYRKNSADGGLRWPQFFQELSEKFRAEAKAASDREAESSVQIVV